MDKMKETYDVMLGLFAEIALDEAIRVKRMSDLRGLIEEALASNNKDDFMKYTLELKGLISHAKLCTG